MRCLNHFVLLLCLLFHFGHMSAQVVQGDSLVLVTLYQELNGDNWTNNSGWMSGPVPNWFGVTVTDGRVAELKLANNNLAGVLPADIGQLSGLKVLEMFINDLEGEIPGEIGGLSNLEVLGLSKNSLAGEVPEEIASLSNLVELNLLSNDLVGPLPDLSPLQNLEKLYLDQNDFSGAFPEWVLDLPKLNTLAMRQVGLTGEVPHNLLTALPDLEYLRLAVNELSGDISLWLNDSTRITSIDIYSNRFRGSIPDSVFGSDLGTFSVARNYLEGLPDFSEINMPMSYLGVEQNKLSFRELRKLDNASTFNSDRLTKGPQRPLLTNDTIVAKSGDEIRIESGSDDDKDLYQWFRDGEELVGENSGELVINSFDPVDEGIYTCIISNPDFEFSLERSPVLLQAEAVSNVQAMINSRLEVWPNPTTGQLVITGIKSKEVCVFDIHGHVLISSASSELDISQLSAGKYLLQVKDGNGEIAAVTIIKL